MHKNLLRGSRGIDWFEFVASKDGAGVNLVTPDPACAPHWFVSINGERTDMPADSLSFKENDVVRVTYGGWDGGEFSATGIDCCREVRGALPWHGKRNYYKPFYDCRTLQKIEGTLFSRFAQTVTDNWFNGCELLEEIPQGLFTRKNGSILLLGRSTFSGCKSLKKADPDLMWNKNGNWYGFAYGSPNGAFQDCAQLVAEFRVNAIECPYGKFQLASGVPDGQITVHVRAGVEFARMLKAGNNSNINIIEDL